MSFLCGCCGRRRREKPPPIPLDAEIKVPANYQWGKCDGDPPTRRNLAFPLAGATRPNFDFVSHDNGETYVATFRALYQGKVMGKDSKPIPKDVFSEFRVRKKKNVGSAYAIYLDTNNHNLNPYFNEMTKEDYELFGITENDKL